MRYWVLAAAALAAGLQWGAAEPEPEQLAAGGSPYRLYERLPQRLQRKADAIRLERIEGRNL